MSTSTQPKPRPQSSNHSGRFVAAAFSDVPHVELAVRRLQEVGVNLERMYVVCSEVTHRHQIAHLEVPSRAIHEEQPAGSHTRQAAAAGGLLGAILGGATALGMTATGVSIVLLGPGAIITGVVAGSFIGAMLTRHEEDELSDFYDQALDDGHFLLGIEVHEDDPLPVDRVRRVLQDLEGRVVMLNANA